MGSVVDSCFALYGVLQHGATNERLCRKIPAHSVLQSNTHRNHAISRVPERARVQVSR